MSGWSSIGSSSGHQVSPLASYAVRIAAFCSSLIGVFVVVIWRAP